MNIVTLFRSHYPEPMLYDVVDTGASRSWTVDELFAEVARVSGGLASLGIGKGERVLMLTGNCSQTYIACLAVWKLGAVVVPLNPLAGTSALCDSFCRLAPAACIYERKLDEALEAALSPGCRVRITLRREPEVQDGECSYAELGSPCADMQDAVDVPGTHPALIVQSTGSQGRPKIIQLSHDDLFRYFHYHDLVHRQFADTAAIGQLQRPLLSIFQPSHFAAYSIVLQGLLMRRPTYLMRDFIPAAYLQLLAMLGCRINILVPSMYIALLKERELIAGLDFTELELCGAIGEPMPQATVARVETAFQARVFSGYGLSECLPGIAHRWEDLQRGSIKPGSCGKRLFDELKLVDQDGKAGSVGELWIRNPTVHRCYLDEALNDSKITPDGWFKTGDLFEIDADGDYFHKGRVDDMFVCNGKNVYPAEVEFVLARHPAVDKVVVAPVSGKDGRVFPAALVQTQAHVDENELLEFFVSAGPSHAIPRFIRRIDSLPQLGPGKFDRNAGKRLLQQMYDAV